MAYFHSRIHFVSLRFANVLLYLRFSPLVYISVMYLNLYGASERMRYLLFMLVPVLFFLILINWLCPAIVLITGELFIVMGSLVPACAPVLLTWTCSPVVCILCPRFSGPLLLYWACVPLHCFAMLIINTVFCAEWSIVTTIYITIWWHNTTTSESKANSHSHLARKKNN